MKIALECEATKEPRASNGNWAYDMLNRITNINWTGPTPVTQQLTYDLAGNITNLVRENGSYTLAYDANDQLISSSGLENRSYVYDALGNRLQDSINGPGEFVNNFLKQNSVSSFLADQEGFGEVAKETTATQEKNYTYRADGKIAGYQSESLAVQYFYDGLGRLVAKAINDGNQYTQSFTHLEDENRVLLGKAGDNSVTTYIDGQGMAERLAEVKGGIGKAYVTDHLGSVLNSAVAGVAKSFGLWGEIAQVPQVSQASAPVNYGFTGHLVDTESGLNRTEFRQYDWKSGRWFSQDPIGLEGKDENFFRYVFNSPVRLSDPKGLKTIFKPAEPEAEPSEELVRTFENLEPGKDYCGSSSNGTEGIPDKVGDIDLRAACAIHDNCYGSAQSRQQCDSDLKENIRMSCDGAKCAAVAQCYYKGVRWGAKGAYVGSGDR